MAEKEQLAVSYAAFVLSGSGADVTAESLNAVLAASGVAVSNTLVNAVAKALKGRNVTEFFGGVGGGSAPAAESAPAPTPAAKEAAKPAAKEAAKPAPPPPPKEEEEDMDMGGLFD